MARRNNRADQDNIKGWNRKRVGKCVDRTAGYSNNDERLRREVGIDLEVDGSEATGSLGDARRGHGWRAP